jgi:predicted tellurium resistance membrane protein TerC
VLLTQFTATLVCIALSDVLFAVDSVPAVLAVSNDPFIVYTSNIAAVVGLRSLYQLLSVAVSDLVYLEKAVAFVLGFVGLKLAAEVVGFEISSALSLVVILSTLGGGVLLSLGDARALDQSDFPER